MTRLYEEVISHLAACIRSDETVSDTWAHTLRAKGTIYTEDELDGMLEIGCRANKWIKNLCYFLDANIIDWNDPLERLLVSDSTSSVGNAYCDVACGGIQRPSLLIHNIVIAAEVIRLLNSSNIRNPTILEIGGGYGVLMAVLRSYYGKHSTIVAVDLPETLCLQEWFLRKRFPEAPVAYSHDSTHVDLVSGGLNFINAHIFRSKTFTFDVAINIDSMCEMPASVVANYIRFIEKNISDGGFFFLQNCYGHSNDAYPELFDYPFDNRWRVQRGRFLHQYETMSHFPITRVTLQRTATNIDDNNLRSILVSIHNQGHATGFSSTGTSTTSSRKSWIEHLSAAVTTFQNDLIELMQASSGATTELKKKLHETTSKLYSHLGGSPQSDYWTGYVASALLPLQNVEIIQSLRERAKATSSDLWKVRFAYLLMRYVSSESVEDLVEELLAKPELEWFLELKLCEILKTSGKSYQSILRRRINAPCNGKTASVVGRTLARLGEVDELLEFIPRALSVLDGDRSVIYDFLSVYLDGRNELPSCLEKLVMIKQDNNEPPFWALAIRHRVGDDTEKLMRKAVDPVWDDYFALGRAGALSMWAGMECANEFLDRSCRLRGDNFLHHQFVGNVRLRANCLSKAKDNFDFVVSKKPYFKNSKAKAIYCSLPTNINESGIFGRATELDMIFASEQDHYHDIGPKYK